MEPAEERFAHRLPDYLASLEGASEDGRRILFLDLLRDVFGVDLAHFQIEERVYGGEVDALLGALVFELKRDLGRAQAEAEAQLSRYITDLHKTYPGRSFTAVATDGVRIMAFSPEYDAQGHVTALAPRGEIDLSQKSLDTTQAYLWLDSLLASFRERRPATTQSVVAGLGPASAAFRTALADLHSLSHQLHDNPAFQLRVGQWKRYLALVYGEETGDTDLFVKHTYLALVARLLASLRLGMGTLPSPKDLADIILGDYFHDRAALANFVEEDFFTWPLLEPVGLEGLALAQRLLSTLQTYDFSQVREDVLKELYQGLLHPADRHDLGEYYTPDWLAELMLRDELRLADDPRRSLLDPSCGSGTFLFIAVRLIREVLEKQGVAPTEILYHIVDNVIGMDVHPLAVTIARTNYLLALGDLLQTQRAVITIPVYLADAIKLPDTTGALGKDGPYAIQAEPNVFLQMPQAMNSEGLDYLLPFMKDKYGRDTIASAATPETEGRGWSAFHSFLVARGNRRKPFALNQDDADVVMETQRVLIDLMRQGKDTLWFFTLRNSLRPAYLERQKFDLIVGNPPWLSLESIHDAERQNWAMKTLEQYDLSGIVTSDKASLADIFFARAADLYLKDGGQIAFVMPRLVMVAQQHARFTGMSFKEGGLLQLELRKLIDLESVSPLFNVPACVLVAEKGPETAYPVEGQVLSGDLLVKSLSLEEARPLLDVRPTTYQRLEGRLAEIGSAVRPRLVEGRER